MAMLRMHLEVFCVYLSMTMGSLEFKAAGVLGLDYRIIIAQRNKVDRSIFTKNSGNTTTVKYSWVLSGG